MEDEGKHKSRTSYVFLPQPGRHQDTAQHSVTVPAILGRLATMIVRLTSILEMPYNCDPFADLQSDNGKNVSMMRTI